MRYTSVGWTVVVPVRLRRRFGLFVCSRWRLPARERNTLPPAVILKRLAADFFVLMPLGRRIIQSISSQKERAIYEPGVLEARGIFSYLSRTVLVPQQSALCQSLHWPRKSKFLPAFGHSRGQTILPALWRVPRPGRQVLRLRCGTTACRHHNQQGQNPITKSHSLHDPSLLLFPVFTF
jgi:hypothetical protein